MNSNGAIATIGMFDGVHRGHCYLLSRLKEEAEAANLTPLVFTFPRHPLSVIAPQKEPEILTSPDDKISLISSIGKVNVVPLEFNSELRMLTAAGFMELLRDRFDVKSILMGYDHRFGHDRIPTLDGYIAAGQRLGINVIIAPPLSDNNINISSSLIRGLLYEGNVAGANRALGHPYSIKAKVVNGKQLGRTIGFPTANLELSCPRQLVPADGVYAVRVILDNDRPRMGMLNIGIRPTVDNSSTPLRTVEVHIFDFDENIYGRTLTVEFIGRIRSEMPFESLDALKQRLTTDREKALEILTLTH